MIHTKEIVVDGAAYSVTQFPATTGVKMLTRLTKIIGEPVAALFMNPDEEVEKAIPAMMSALSSRLDEDQVVDTLKTLVTTARCSEGDINFDLHFAGRIGHLFKLSKAILEVQYGDFLGVIAARGLDSLKAKKA